ncbi:MAG: right-handed parallel beta-helix repeat-containing protein [Candidatus Pacebacteria bacterium]|nr:right-handed parallel beta-helix repeat-containing protein [Candidatus Paceibacterota bacterium]
MTLIPLALAGLFLNQNAFAFDDLTTHPALTDEVIDFYNLFAGEKINNEDKETIIQGAQDEDIPPRWINHFYDPVRNLGWSGRNTGVWPQMLVHYFSGTVLSSEYPVSSLNWLHNQELQSKYSRYKGNRTWEKALYEYAKGNKKEAYYTLGYILHLIEDASVPDHTRDDPHAHEMRYATGDYGSPLEEYAKNFNRDNLNIASELKEKNFKPAEFDSVDKYLTALAEYSNGRFFSKDTINDPLYANPKIVREDDSFGYGLDKNEEEFELVRVKTTFADNGDMEKEYYLNDKEEKEILSQYFSRLSREAVIHGAGVIELFFREAEAIKNGQKPAPEIFRETPPEPAKALLLFYINPVLGIMAYGNQNFSATGEFFKVVSLTNSTKEIIQNFIPVVAKGIKELFTQDQPAELLLAGAAGATSGAENTQPAVPNIVSGIAESADSSENEASDQDNLIYIQNSLEEMRRQIEELAKNQNNLSEPRLSLAPEVSVPVPLAEENKIATAENRPKIFLVSLVYPGFGGGGGTIPQPQTEQTQEEQAPEDLNLVGEPENEPEAGDEEQESAAFLPPNLSAPQCADSLATDGCLLATTTVNFVWPAVSGASYYGINKNGDYATTTELSFAAIVPDFSDYNFSISAIAINNGVATTSATSTQTVSVATIPIAINEVAWMGTGASVHDEWLELKNNTARTLDLSRWAIESKDGAPYIALSGQMAPREYRVLQRRENALVINAPIETYGNGSPQWALGNNGEELVLYFASTTLDKTPAITGGKWVAGDNSNASGRKSMERIDSRQSGATSTNWATWGTNVDFIKNGTDSDGNPILGTPGECNSASYASVNNGEEIEDNLTLAANGCYYASFGEMVVASSTLTIEAGARINLTESDLEVEGVLKVQGEKGNPVVFSTFSGEQTWNGIQIYGGAGTSTINHTIIKNISGVVLDEGATAEITNSEFINNRTGVELYDESSVVIENINFASTTNEAVAAYDGSNATAASSTIINSINNGAISVYESSLSISSTTIDTVYNGDGIGVYDSVVSIANTAVSNVLSGDGIALYDSEAALENVKVANVSGEGVAVYDSNVSGIATVDGEEVEF